MPKLFRFTAANHEAAGELIPYQPDTIDPVSGHLHRGILRSFSHTHAGGQSVRGALIYGTHFRDHRALREYAGLEKGHNAGMSKVGRRLQPVWAMATFIPGENGISIDAMVGNKNFQPNDSVADKSEATHLANLVALTMGYLMLEACQGDPHTTSVQASLWYSCLRTPQGVKPAPEYVFHPTVASFDDAVAAQG